MKNMDGLFLLLMAMMCLWIAATGKGHLRFGGLATGRRIQASGALLRTLLAVVAIALGYFSYRRFTGKPLPPMLDSYIVGDVLLMGIGVAWLVGGLAVERYRKELEAIAIGHCISPRFVVAAVRTLAMSVGAVLLVSGAYGFVHHI